MAPVVEGGDDERQEEQQPRQHEEQVDDQVHREDRGQQAGGLVERPEPVVVGVHHLPGVHRHDREGRDATPPLHAADLEPGPGALALGAAQKALVVAPLNGE